MVFLSSRVALVANLCCSAINQQIAIKTIARLGFSVSAVWNGKEALDYLLSSSTSKPSRPRRPDLILMDVQMPILDGYRATHLIRHHSPYVSLPDIQKTPIVAMTASAIQGDREKCERAGMDDYLAKPVRSHTLETMLVKWALRRKESAADAASYKSHHTHTDTDSNCTDLHSYSVNLPTTSTVGTTATKDNTTPGPAMASATPRSPNVGSAPARRPTNSLSTTSSAGASAAVGSRLLPPSESEGERSLRRVAAEEKAVELRNDKLLSAAEEEPHATYQGAGLVHSQLSPSSEVPRLPVPGRLTVENVGKLGGQRGAGGDDAAAGGSWNTGTRTGMRSGQGIRSGMAGDEDDEDEDEQEKGREHGGHESTVQVGEGGRGEWDGILGASSAAAAKGGDGREGASAEGGGAGKDAASAHSRNTSLHAHRGSVDEPTSGVLSAFKNTPSIPQLAPTALAAGREEIRSASPLASPPLVAEPSPPPAAAAAAAAAGGGGGGGGGEGSEGKLSPLPAGLGLGIGLGERRSSSGSGSGSGSGRGRAKRPHLSPAGRRSSERTVRPDDR